MGLGKTFVNAAVREVGRSVGKGVSNDLFGDWHATPIRGSISNSRPKGKNKYAGQFDRLSQGFTVGTAATTKNKAVNVFNAYQDGFDAATSDGNLDIVEVYHLTNEAILCRKLLNRATEHLDESFEGKGVDVINKKIEELTKMVDKMKSSINPVEPVWSFGSWLTGKYQKKKALYQAMVKTNKTLNLY